MALPPLLLAGCAQGSLAVSPGTVMSAIILAGEAAGGAHAPITARVPPSRAPSAAAARVLGTADQYVGVKYTWGGNTPQSGFDCSGFTRFVFAHNGVDLPRTSREQSRVGDAVKANLAALVPGDLMFFAEPGAAISHVAIYVGNGTIIHSSEGFGGVNYLDLNTSRGDWYVQNLVAVRRVF
jgi:cell wall-associated NlpC family hydrolase